jgi:hypothetical protein
MVKGMGAQLPSTHRILPFLTWAAFNGCAALKQGQADPELQPRLASALLRRAAELNRQANRNI